jgi:hypothetical protein
MKINFQFNTKYGPYVDALILPDDHTYTDSEILAMQLERVTAWVALVEANSNAQ